MERFKQHRGLLGVFYILLSSLFLISFSSCSEENEEDDEYANWQERNDAAIDSWAANSNFRKILTYTKDQTAAQTSSSVLLFVTVLPLPCRICMSVITGAYISLICWAMVRQQMEAYLPIVI